MQSAPRQSGWERVAAVVVTRDGGRPDLADYSRGRLANFEIPERITFAEELPVTAKGSVDRSKVAKRFGRQSPPDENQIVRRRVSRR